MDRKKHGSIFFDLWMFSELPTRPTPAQGHLLSDHHILLLVNHCNKYLCILMPLSLYIRFEHRIKSKLCKEFRFAFCYSGETMTIFRALVFEMYLRLSYLVVAIMIPLFRYIQGTKDGFRSNDKRSVSLVT